jgi:hypothetical protein
LKVRERLRLIRINNYLKLGSAFGILQFLVFLLEFDYLLTWGPFVAHHFIELPAFFTIGVGFSILYYDMKLSSTQAQVLNQIIFTLNLFPFSSGDLNGVVASFLVSSPELLGFYYHRARYTHERV